MNIKGRRQLHANFHEKNQDLIDKVLDENLPYPDNYKSVNAKALIELAREEIGFSYKTLGYDIFRSLMWHAKRSNKQKPLTPMSETNEGMNFKNLPKAIWLSLDKENLDPDLDPDDFDSYEHEFTYWNQSGPINKTDPKYVLESELTSRLQTDKQVEENRVTVDEIVKVIQTELLKQTFPMVHTMNGYPSDAVPKAVIIDMLPLVKSEITKLFQK